MAFARKCDRCGQYYDPNTVNPDNHNGFMALEIYGDGDNNGTSIYKMDLCPECTAIVRYVIEKLDVEIIIRQDVIIYDRKILFVCVSNSIHIRYSGINRQF